MLMRSQILVKRMNFVTKPVPDPRFGACKLLGSLPDIRKQVSTFLRKEPDAILYLSIVLHSLNNCLAFHMSVNMQRCFLLVHSLSFSTCFGLMRPSSDGHPLTEPAALLCRFYIQFCFFLATWFCLVRASLISYLQYTMFIVSVVWCMLYITVFCFVICSFMLVLKAGIA
jgi:hypothetical protein